ncbi:LOS biosynthesis enzyme LBGB [Agarivorans sp. Toyoura001]|uniref:glycosyltransferase family 9 protein n=1 Tax=Agarivorans sp. Toyoura001 TaxID=2283141 RepID=UPI0010F3F816|nr:glycosyltransferase family 9 protein [Agarivorans sp. Toyoura001]GDY27290.1 LOS biosynthesis enzyme LBGB [Agarivorans sp. Toyoura001]
MSIISRIFDLRHPIKLFSDTLRKKLALMIFDTKTISELEPKSSKRILFWRTDGKIGDSVISSFIYKELKAFYPKLEISVLTLENAKGLFETNPYIDNVYLYKKRPNLLSVPSLLKEIPQQDTIVFLGRFMKPRDILALRLLKAHNYIGLEKDAKIINYNILADCENQHYQQQFLAVAKVMGLNIMEPQYTYNINHRSELRVSKYLDDIDRPYICINPFGSANSRCLTADNILKIGKELNIYYPNHPLVVLCSPDQLHKLTTIETELKSINAQFMSNSAHIDDSACLIKHAKLLVSVDTATVHIAKAFEVPLIAIYLYGPNEYQMWHPNHPNSKTVFCKKPLSSITESNINDFSHKELERTIRENIVTTEGNVSM